MDRGAWWATVNRVTKSWTQLSNLAHKNPLYLSSFSIRKILLKQHVKVTEKILHGFYGHWLHETAK